MWPAAMGPGLPSLKEAQPKHTHANHPRELIIQHQPWQSDCVTVSITCSNLAMPASLHAATLNALASRLVPPQGEDNVKSSSSTAGKLFAVIHVWVVKSFCSVASSSVFSMGWCNSQPSSLQRSVSFFLAELDLFMFALNTNINTPVMFSSCPVYVKDLVCIWHLW